MREAAALLEIAVVGLGRAGRSLDVSLGGPPLRPAEWVYRWAK